MKISMLIFAIGLLALMGCSEDDSGPQPTYFVATIDGELVQFQSPRVLIKRENGFPYSREVTADVTLDDTVEKVITFIYAGELNAATADNGFLVLMGAYYENDYAESWTGTGGPGSIEFTMSAYNPHQVSGTFSDFTAVNGGDSLLINDIAFENIPIRYLDF